MTDLPRYHINVFWYPDDQCWIADVPDLRPCSARGETAQLALAALDPVQSAWLDAARETGEPVPEPRYCPALFTAG
ncbi:MAG: type II toxin-antitoxin system HicB family antitoxin [Novosphingobium sp.]|jgi:predicted RNase H-like HicB family nuclease|nr:type II toxin-antitoxin system HicB family antitoxin [Novosphingobium sp.]MBP6554584.1 type II toxin-antitoxin system HicB family antitoxin [Novosphingobium sp.]